MYAVELSFSNDPARLDGRPAHRERLLSLCAEGRLLAAGPFADDSGALLLFRIETHEELEAVIASDPYYSGPGVTVVSVKQWHPVALAPGLD